MAHEQEFTWLQHILESKFEICTVVCGPGANNANEAKVWNRIITVDDDGYTYEAAAIHSELLVKNLGQQSAKPVSRLGGDVSQECEEVLLEFERFKHFQPVCARANFLAIDLSDIQHTTEELCRSMSRLA